MTDDDIIVAAALRADIDRTTALLQGHLNWLPRSAPAAAGIRGYLMALRRVESAIEGLEEGAERADLLDWDIIP